MSDSNSNSGNGFLYFIVGALVAAVAAFGVYYFTGMGDKSGADVSISVSEDGIEIDGE